jgi:hypothetical protein
MDVSPNRNSFDIVRASNSTLPSTKGNTRNKGCLQTATREQLRWRSQQPRSLVLRCKTFVHLCVYVSNIAAGLSPTNAYLQ